LIAEQPIAIGEKLSLALNTLRIGLSTRPFENTTGSLDTCLNGSDGLLNPVVLKIEADIGIWEARLASYWLCPT
jgi:hypothetical protein